MGAYLPKDPESLSDALLEIYRRGEEARAHIYVEWVINYWSLQGCRNFLVKSWKTGEVLHTFETSDGRLHYRHEDLLEHYNRELGQWLATDPRPRVTPKRRLELDSLRKAAFGQVLLENITAPLDLRLLLLNSAEKALMYGTVGLGAWVNRDVNLAVDAMVETIPPWQILPVPARPTCPDDVRGLMRHRWVPYKELRERQGDTLKFPRKDSDKSFDPRLDIRYVRPGDRILNEHDSSDVLAGASVPAGCIDEGMNSRPRNKTDATEEPWVRVIEYWAFDHKNNVLRSSVLLGEFVAKDVSFLESVVKPYMPVHLARCNHSGSFFARSYLSGLVSLNQETERMLATLFKNVQELDQFGMLLLPTNRGITKRDLESTSKPRVAFFETDFTGERMQVERIQPVNTGDFPGRVAAQAIQLSDRQGRNNPMFQGDAPGRMDAASGLGILLETSSISRRPGLLSLARAFSGVYGCLLSASKSLFSVETPLYLATIDDAVAGIVVDPATGSLSLANNPVPHPSEVEISLASEEPRIVAQRKQELLSLAQSGMISPDSLAWLNHVEGLGIPLDSHRAVEQRLLCMWRNIIQFGDGTTGQGVLVSPYDDHELHLGLIRSFMSRIQFQLASSEVKNLFEDRILQHEQYLGMRLPEGMPHPEELAGGVPGGPPPLPPGLPPILLRKAQKLAAQAGNQQAGALVQAAPSPQ